MDRHLDMSLGSEREIWAVDVRFGSCQCRDR